MEQCIYDITIKKGANFYFLIEYYSRINGVEAPIDLTGYYVEMQIRETLNSTAIFDTYSTTNGIITLNEANGLIIVNVPYATTEIYEEGFKGVYQVEILSPSNFKDRDLGGKVLVSSEVVR